MEVVLPIEMGVRSLRTVLENEIPKKNWLQSRYDQLCMLDEKRLKALYHIQGYQRRLKKAFNKKVRTKDLKLGDLVLKEIKPWFKMQTGSSSKIRQIHTLSSKYIPKGVVRLMDLEANPFTVPTNMDQLKKYHI